MHEKEERIRKFRTPWFVQVGVHGPLAFANERHEWDIDGRRLNTAISYEGPEGLGKESKMVSMASGKEKGC